MERKTLDPILDPEIVGPLPAGYDDDRTDPDILVLINQVLLNDLAIRGDGAKKQSNRRRRDWDTLWPSFLAADITTIESLSDVAAQGRLLKSLTERAKELGGTHHTVDGRLQGLLWGLKAAGLDAEILQRLKKNFKRIRKATGYTMGSPKGYTMEQWSQVAKTADLFVSHPPAYAYRMGQSKFSERTAKMTRAALWVGVSGALRISEVSSINVDAIDASGYTYRITKHRDYADERWQPFLTADCWKHVESYLKVREGKGDDVRLFTATSATISRMIQAVLLEAGIPKRNGRVGLHGFRHLFASDSLTHDYGGVEGRQHMLGHRSADTQHIYTEAAAKAVAVERASGPWQERLAEAAGHSFKWDGTMGAKYYAPMLAGDMPLVPQEALGPGKVIFDSFEGVLGLPVCFHNDAVMCPLLDLDGETFDWAIIEVKNHKPTRIIVKRQSLGWARPDLNWGLTEPIAAFFDGYLAAMNDLGVPPSQ